MCRALWISISVYIDWMMRNNSVTGDTMYFLKSDTGIGRNMAHLANRVGAFVRSDGAPYFPGIDEAGFCHAYPTFDDENNLSLVYVLRIYSSLSSFPATWSVRAGSGFWLESPVCSRPCGTATCSSPHITAGKAGSVTTCSLGTAARRMRSSFPTIDIGTTRKRPRVTTLQVPRCGVPRSEATCTHHAV